MKSKTLIYSIGLLVLITVFLCAAYVSSIALKVSGSTVVGNDYVGTTTTSSFASATTIKQLKGNSATCPTCGAGALGSVIISSSSPITTYPTLTLYDATSTMATATARVLGRFGTNNQEHGTYTFDEEFRYGLSIEVPAGFNGNYTITWR